MGTAARTGPAKGSGVSRRAFIGGTAAATLAPVLAACGGAGTQGEQAAALQLPKEPVLLTYITWVGADQVALMQKAADVVKQKHPNIGVEVQTIPQAQMILKPTTMAAAGIPPDVVETNDKQIVDSIARNLFSDLMPLVNRDKGAVQLEDFYPVYISGMKWQNKLLAMPDFTGTSVMYFNKNLFDESGVKYPTADWTWEDLETAGRRMQGRYPEGSNVFTIQPFFQDIRWFPYIAWGYGGSMVEGSGIIPPDKTQVKVYSPTNIRQLQRYLDWVNKLHIIARPGETSDWAGGKQALDMRGKDSVPSYLRLEWMKAGAGMTLPPKGTSPRRSRTTTRGATIPNGVKYKDASWEVIKSMTSKEGMEITVSGGYSQPVRKSVEAAFAKTLQPFEDLKVYQESQKHYAEGVPYHAQWIELEPVVKLHIESAIKGEYTADQALKNLQQAMELTFKQAAENGGKF